VPLLAQIYAIPHPLVKHWLAVARNASTPPPMFRSACAELGRLLIYEATRDFLPTLTGEIDTPVAPAEVEFVDASRPVKVGRARTWARHPVAPARARPDPRAGIR
jgi:uracil phosphoribosyltransferase